ncbi:MAG: helix-turn-helix domain-containing protein [Desulfuromonadales bacterium]|nr:MAG: helix-turn-helix domain-containing protein [Desulfuromonadales bacterium]
MQSNSTLHYDELEAYPCQLPPPSQLYHLEPIDIGSPLVESLSSYVVRLAEAHMHTPSTIVRYVVSPLLNHTYFDPDKTTSMSYKAAGAMSGRSKTAGEWVGALEKLTLRKDLSFTTFLPFQAIFPDKGLLKADRAWCPLCIECWKSEGKPVYEPLLWKVQEVVVCPIHQTGLITICPNCQRKLPHISSNLVSGHCSRCGRWLGHSDATMCSGASEEQIWAAKSVGDLLAHSPSATSSPGKEAIMGFFDNLIKGRKGSARGLAAIMGVNHSYIIDWRNGKYIPTIGALLHICRSFRESLVEVVFSARIQKKPATMPRNGSVPNMLTQKRAVKRQNKINWESVEADLADMETNELQVGVIAKRYQCSPSSLYRKFPDLCRKVSTLRHQNLMHKRTEHDEEIKQKIRLAVNDLVSQGISVKKSAIYELIGGRSDKKSKLINEIIIELGNADLQGQRPDIR